MYRSSKMTISSLMSKSRVLWTAVTLEAQLGSKKKPEAERDHFPRSLVPSLYSLDQKPACGAAAQ